MLHKQWRDCQEWRKYGIHLGTSSNEVAKLYDAAITQYVGQYDDDSVGGLQGALSRMIDTDENFVMGHVLCNGVELFGVGRSPVLDNEFKARLSLLEKLSLKPTVSIWEKKHADAIKLLGQGKWKAACHMWDDILIDNPLDLVALKFLTRGCFFMGMNAQCSMSIDRVMPYWNQDMPLQGYIHGLHAFELAETQFYDRAEKLGRKGLELNEKDAWSAHAIVHVMEHQGRINEGINFLSSTQKHWQSCNLIAGHNFWHWGLFHIEKGEYQSAMDIYDSEVARAFKTSGSILRLSDCATALLRLEMEGQSVGSRWDDLFEKSRPHIDDHLSTLGDVSIMLVLLGSKHRDVAESMMQSMDTFIRDAAGDNRDILSSVGRPMCQAIIAYRDGHYAEAVDIMAPIRHDLTKTGGSNAFRDVYNLFLINAAIKSPSPAHHTLSRHLLAERKAFQENSSLTDRLIAKDLACHQ